MTGEISATVYRYDELPTETAKLKAIEEYRRNLGLDCVWVEQTILDIVQCAEQLNFVIERNRGAQDEPAVFWRLSPAECTMGGRWSAEGFDPQKITEHAPQDEQLKRIAEKLSVAAKERPPGDEPASVQCRDVGPGDSMLEGNSESAKAAILDFCRWAARRIEQEWEWQTSRKAIEEVLRDRQDEFLEDGQHFDQRGQTLCN